MDPGKGDGKPSLGGKGYGKGDGGKGAFGKGKGKSKGVYGIDDPHSQWAAEWDQQWPAEWPPAQTSQAATAAVPPVAPRYPWMSAAAATSAPSDPWAWACGFHSHAPAKEITKVLPIAPEQRPVDAKYGQCIERECRRLRPDIAVLDELRRGCEDFAAEAEEGEKSYYFNIGPHDKLNFKFVRTAFGNFTLHLAQLIGPAFYFGFFVDWCVLTLCLWGLTIYDWWVFVLPRKRDDVALRHERDALL